MSLATLAQTVNRIMHTKLCRHAMQCMEIWGGSHAANTNVATPGLDLWVYSRPYEGAKDGGDVHYVSLCGGGVITRFIISDVAGHGAKVAALAGSLRDLMRRNINCKQHEGLVRSLNRQFAELNHQGRFATAIIGSYLADRDQLMVSNAGHPSPLIYRSNRKAWTSLMEMSEGGVNLPLGIDGSSSFVHQEIALRPGDLILFYTDAATETTDLSGRQLGQEGLMSLVEDLDVDAPAAMTADLAQRIDAFHDDQPLSDDLTILLLHHNAGDPPRLSLRQKFDVYAKVFGFKGV